MCVCVSVCMSVYLSIYTGVQIIQNNYKYLPRWGFFNHGLFSPHNIYIYMKNKNIKILQSSIWRLLQVGYRAD